MNKREVGAGYEELACRYLNGHGVHIRARNFRSRAGEIDIVAQDRDAVVFVEVKYRKSDVSGSGAAAVHAKKQKTISRVADYYRTLHHLRESVPIRFDVVEITACGDKTVKVRWYKNAFSYIASEPKGSHGFSSTGSVSN